MLIGDLGGTVVGVCQRGDAIGWLDAVGGVDRREPSPEHRHVGFDQPEHLQHASRQLAVGLGLQPRQTELGGHHRRPLLLEIGHVAVEGRLQRLGLFDQGVQRVSELHQVPLRDGRLGAEAVTAVGRVGRVRRPVGVVVVEPAIGAIVDRETQDRHVVGVHHTVDETDPQPLAHHVRSRSHHLVEELHIPIRRPVGRQVGEIGIDDEVGQRAQRLDLAARSEDLEVAKSNERGRHAAHHRPRLRRRVAVIEHVAHDHVAGPHEAERPGGGHAEVSHGLAAEELAHRTAQYRQAVSGA